MYERESSASDGRERDALRDVAALFDSDVAGVDDYVIKISIPNFEFFVHKYSCTSLLYCKVLFLDER